MPFNPSGVFQRLYRWVTDRDNNIAIDATRMDAETDGIVAGLNAVVSQAQPFTGPLKAPGGTVLTPGFSFGNDPNTGVYRAGEDAVGLAAGGANVATFNVDGLSTARVTTQYVELGGRFGATSCDLDFHSNGIDTTTDYDARIRSGGGVAGTPGRGVLQFFATQAVLPFGTASAPGMGFIGDATTGIYRSSAGVLGIATGGASRLTVGSDGVTSSFGFNAPVGTEAAPAIQFSNANNGIYWSLGGGPLFTAGGSTIARLTGGTALTTADAIVTRQAGDLRYAQTSVGYARLTAANTFTALNTIDANTGALRFVKDASQRTVADFFTGTSTLAFVLRMTAGGDLEFQGSGSRQFAIRAPVTLGLGSGDIFLENNASDGDGAGLCVRTSTNPTGNGMIFSARSSGGALGLGVQTSKISSARPDMYLGSTDAGANGDRVLHTGIGTGGIGTYAMLGRVDNASDIAPGGTVAGSSMSYVGYATGGSSQDRVRTFLGASPGGTWRLMGILPANPFGESTRAVSTLCLRIS